MFSGLHNSRNWAWPDAGWVFRDQMAAIPAEEISDQAVLVRLPAVSVIMLAYNHAPWLEEAVESVMRQQLGEPFELLIGEDRSSDHTLDLALSLQRRWPERIRVIHAPTNVGMRDNVLRLLVRARASVAALLEGDDYWVCDTKLQQQLALLKADPSLSCVAGFTQNRPASLPPNSGSRFRLPDLLRRYPVHFSALAFRTELAIPYPNFPNGAFDSMLLSLLASKGDCGMLLKPLSYYRRHPAGYWTGAERFQRLRLTGEFIDAINAFFFGRFIRELADRELWIYEMDWQLPEREPWTHWRQSWGILYRQTSRLLVRSPMKLLLLSLRTLLQPLSYVIGWMRRKLSLGSRLRHIFGISQP